MTWGKRDYTILAAALGPQAPPSCLVFRLLLPLFLITTSGRRVEPRADIFHKATMEIRPRGGPADGQKRNETWRGNGR